MKIIFHNEEIMRLCHGDFGRMMPEMLKIFRYYLPVQEMCKKRCKKVIKGRKLGIAF